MVQLSSLFKSKQLNTRKKKKKKEEEEKEVPVADIIMFIALIVCEKTNFE